MTSSSLARSAARRFHLALLGAAALAVGACALPADESTGTTRAAATAFANDQTAYDYFAAKGLTNFQAAGIVGNLDQESGVDPTAVESGGPGRGIAQWSVGGRWDTYPGDNVLAYATQQGQSSSSLTLQLDFIWFELQTIPDYGLAKLQATTNVTDATVAFEDDFEGCSQCDESTRISYAQDVLKAYGNDPVLTDAGTPHDSGTSHDGGASIDAALDSATPPEGDDASSTSPTPDSGGTGGTGGSGEEDASTGNGGSGSGSSGGCAVGRAGDERSNAGAVWIGLGLVIAGARRRRSATTPAR